MFDEKWLREYQARTGCRAYEGGRVLEPDGAKTEKTAKRGKYGNEKTELDGERFDSRHEAKVWAELSTRAKAGEYAGIARQVTFFLPGGVRYVADFVLMKKDGSYEVLDAKSEATARNAVYRLKKRQMRECLGIEIREV